MLVAPPAGAWIETDTDRQEKVRILTSRPPRARGLKLVNSADTWQLERSRPPRARGLKQSGTLTEERGIKVAPPAGAWIETSILPEGFRRCPSRAPRGRVD
ncbi:hypothetical protein SPIRO4BDMA_50631 [uncultured spirochete]|uniref:Uncharacterized protein n=1 Tax=uncultured spirochete TaxID=156406 RepID=A0A3P3XS33_9SPIR|nr:hypothetical protein SPIRO4BDMA_50631 [uncultured spirochete]